MIFSHRQVWTRKYKLKSFIDFSLVAWKKKLLSFHKFCTTTANLFLFANTAWTVNFNFQESVNLHLAKISSRKVFGKDTKKTFITSHVHSCCLRGYGSRPVSGWCWEDNRLWFQRSDWDLGSWNSLLTQLLTFKSVYLSDTTGESGPKVSSVYKVQISWRAPKQCQGELFDPHLHSFGIVLTYVFPRDLQCVCLKVFSPKL